MAQISLSNVTLTFPMLGQGMQREVAGEVSGPGAITRDKRRRGRSIVALDGLSLSLQDGDRIALIGRNGSGKSTLLRVMAGIYEPLEGAVSISGRIASMFTVGLGVRLEATGYRNIVLSGLVSGLSRAQIEEQIDEIADFAELGPYLNMPLRTYSNGMAMRLKFACATAFQPDILLMDEWLGAGDGAFKAKAEGRMKALVNQAGILVLASHSNALLSRMCNKAVWLNAGQLKMIGPTDEVIAAYETFMSEQSAAAAPQSAAAE